MYLGGWSQNAHFFSFGGKIGVEGEEEEAMVFIAPRTNVVQKLLTSVRSSIKSQVRL